MFEHFEWNWLGILWAGLGGIGVTLAGIAVLLVILLLLTGNRFLVPWVIVGLMMLSGIVAFASLVLGMVTAAYWGIKDALSLAPPGLLAAGVALVVFVWLRARHKSQDREGH